MSSLMAYHAIGRIKTGNLVGGSLMISSLPISYLLLKLGCPAYSVFIAIFSVNFIQMVYSWWLIHGYVSFSYSELLKKVYLPTIIISIFATIPPLILYILLPDGWLRLLLILFVTEICLIPLVYYIGLDKGEQSKLLTLLRRKIRKKWEN